MTVSDAEGEEERQLPKSSFPSFSNPETQHERITR